MKHNPRARSPEEVYDRNLLEASLDPLVAINIEGKFTFVNEATVKVTGVPRYALIGSDFSSYFTAPDKAREGFLQVFRTGSVTDYPLTIRHKDGHLTELLCNASVYRDKGGKDAGIFAAARDITERKRAEDEVMKLNLELEQRVRERTAQLESANSELESFSYSVSHDLRAPLRSLDGFSQAILEEYSDRLDEKGKDYLGRIRLASQRMGQLIDDMLKLSRVTRSEMRFENVDLTGIAREIGDELSRAEPGRKVEFIIEDGVTAWGDLPLMRTVMQNLLSNSWKFTSRHEKGLIQFGVSESGGRKNYFVKDDGAGFDMTYADKLFTPFQRLHSTAEFPGTGIGLVIAKRIIKRHGGEIWASSEPEKGATFYFLF
jgi:PAS domain S-box-containing protein